MHILYTLCSVFSNYTVQITIFKQNEMYLKINDFADIFTLLNRKRFYDYVRNKCKKTVKIYLHKDICNL